jgi:hypothetical protein
MYRAQAKLIFPESSAAVGRPFRITRSGTPVRNGAAALSTNQQTHLVVT